ncbi:MAG: hypothetical protein H0W36_00975 [Gemmatimonadetes bacterium]|nr:hypothetical protein [Gemmatimonadota bacterium]
MLPLRSEVKTMMPSPGPVDVHVTSNVVDVAPAEGTVTVRGLGAVTVQLAATPWSST